MGRRRLGRGAGAYHEAFHTALFVRVEPTDDGAARGPVAGRVDGNVDALGGRVGEYVLYGIDVAVVAHVHNCCAREGRRKLGCRFAHVLAHTTAGPLLIDGFGDLHETIMAVAALPARSQVVEVFAFEHGI